MTCISHLPSCSGESGAERVYNEKPSGDFNCINLSFTTAQEFDPDTVIIRLDGVALDPVQYTLGIDNQSFTLLVDADDPKALNDPPDSEECLRVDYTLNQISASGGCITFL